LDLTPQALLSTASKTEMLALMGRIGRGGWKANNSFTSFTYKNKGTGTPLIQGIKTVKAKVTSPTSVKFTVKGGTWGRMGMPAPFR
jgi:hypothetical protein